jgi:hypothetical protein
MAYDLKETTQYKDIGHPAEILAQEIIKNMLNVNIIETCDDYKYDFKDSNNTTYEIKADKKSHITNNFFIVYAQKFKQDEEYKPAGISRSIADYYMIMYGDSFYKIKREIILFMIIAVETRKEDYERKTFKNDRNEFIKGILIKVEDIKKYATIYNFK